MVGLGVPSKSRSIRIDTSLVSIPSIPKLSWLRFIFICSLGVNVLGSLRVGLGRSALSKVVVLSCKCANLT